MHLPRVTNDIDIILAPRLAEKSDFLRIPQSMQKLEVRTCVKQLLTASSPLSNNLKAAMAPSDYSRLMELDVSSQDRLSPRANLNIMSTALFLFRNSLNEENFDLGYQMFVWFQATYDAQVFRTLADNKDPLTSSITEKLFRQAVWAGDNNMVRELLRTGVDPNQCLRIFDPSRRIHAEPKTAIQIACCY